jgi:hypothetical protein
MGVIHIEKFTAILKNNSITDEISVARENTG